MNKTESALHRPAAAVQEQYDAKVLEQKQIFAKSMLKTGGGGWSSAEVKAKGNGRERKERRGREWRGEGWRQDKRQEGGER